MLDLHFDPVGKLYSAPVQMKANNGVLIVDDFGRQLVRPEALLNRWIMPLPFDLFVGVCEQPGPCAIGGRGVPAAYSEQDQD
jgi:hypothetical protein